MKDGTQSTAKRILIGGQQRVLALRAALLGEQIVNKSYKRTRITIAFHPGEESFEAANAAIRRDRGWIADIATVFAPDTKILRLVDEYCEANQGVDKDDIRGRLERLRGIRNNAVGLIDINADLDVEAVTEIFVRINSQGVALNAADFAMSKMAASERHNGHLLRKYIDSFCHLAVALEAYGDLAEDGDFAATDYFGAMAWLRNEKEELYDPSYTDMLRAAFTSEFERGRLEDLVALLSGRNFETRAFEETIAEQSFHRLDGAVRRYMNETNFKRFFMILRSAGFVHASMIRSRNTVNFAYILFLKLREQNEAPERIETLVRRWFVMSVLTGRYTGSPETAFTRDIRDIAAHGETRYLDALERAELSGVFWDVGLQQQMDASVASSPYFNVFLATQVRRNDKGFLSRDLTVRDLLEGRWPVHRVFPRSYLQKHGLSRDRYNHIANYVVMQSETNDAIADGAPAEYFSGMRAQCENGETRYGGIVDADQLQSNLTTHCIPAGMETASIESYDGFLEKRRNLMASKIRDYYETL